MATDEQTGCNEHKPPSAEFLAAENERLRRRIAELELLRIECPARKEFADRVYVEGAPQGCECHLQEMANSVREAFWIIDWRARKTIYVSPAYEEIWGRSIQAVYERHEEWIDSIHPDDREFAMASLATAVETSGGEPREYRIVRPDGTIRWISDRAYAVRDQDGRVHRVAGVAKDITSRKEAEEALRESQLRLTAAVESLPCDFFMLDNDGRYTMFNSVAREHWGDCTGRRPEDLCPDEATLALWLSNNRRALAGEVVRAEVQMAPHGQEGHYYNIISPIRDGSEIHGILGVNIDITALKQAEEALQRANDVLEFRVKERTAELEAEVDRRRQLELDLRASEQRYRSLVESSGDAISTVTEDGGILFVNGVLAQWFGVSAEAMVGQHVQDFFPQPFADEQVAYIRQAVRTGQAVNVTVLAPVTEAMRWFHVTFEPLCMGETPAALVVARDIDDLVRTREQIEKYREQMACASRLASLGTLSATVAHEMTQPLTVLRLSIQNALEAIRMGSAPSVAVEDLKCALEALTTMADITERFRGFARSSSSRQWLDIDLSAIADRIIELTAEAARIAKVGVSVRGLDTLPKFRARVNDMEQLFFALLMNAIQAVPIPDESGLARTIVISGQVHDSAIELCFEDTCGGIASENVEQIFKPFFTTRAHAGGTGLGLSVVENILDRYAGKLKVFNRPGDGATFQILLPLCPGSQDGPSRRGMFP
ncbi:PAS domain-containing sensor histidine kinase [Anaerobaca lacustris]|uniref:histidine kinase n=1 Tax=Anaerobaca lacustris TaxID=3044600 RepID=A0AAW6TR91_9BACT|nr:PAS domain S-box protein [Sedimentisphaerales bacterium M17dextr]